MHQSAGVPYFPLFRSITVVLSHKFVDDSSYFRNKCCRENMLAEKHNRDKCETMINTKNFDYFLNRTQDCSDPHWEPQVYAIDDKWWSKIDYIGYIASIQEDTKSLLRSLTSVKDERTAWDKVGKDGWFSSDGTEGGFMQTNAARHAGHARDKMLLQYTPRTEQFVEEHGRLSGSTIFFILKSFISSTKHEGESEDEGLIVSLASSNSLICISFICYLYTTLYYRFSRYSFPPLYKMMTILLRFLRGKRGVAIMPICLQTLN